MLNILVIAYVRPDKLAKLLKILEFNKEKIAKIIFWVNQGYDQETISRSATCIQMIKESSLISFSVERPQQHLSVDQSIPAALDNFFYQCGGGLILEDDCLPSKEFINFLIKTDIKTKLNPIAGSNSLSGLTSHSQSTVIYRPAFFFQVWGWYGNASLWNTYRNSFVKKLSSWSFYSIYKALRAKGFARKFCLDFAGKIFLAERGIIKTWDYQFSFFLLERGITTWVPSQNLVENIGFDGSATNTFAAPSHYTYKTFKEDFSISCMSELYTDFNGLYQKTSFLSLLKVFRRWVLQR